MFRELRLYALMEVGEKDEDTKAAVREWRLGTEHSQVGCEPATPVNQQQSGKTHKMHSHGERAAPTSQRPSLRSHGDSALESVF